MSLPGNVQKVTINDLDKIVPFLCECYFEMKWQGLGYPLDPPSIYQSLANILKNKDILFIKYQENEIIKGVCLFLVIPWFFAKNHRCGREIIWHAKPSLSKTIKSKIMVLFMEEIINYAKNNSINTLHIGIKQQTFNISHFLTKHGFKESETIYVKEVV